MQGCFKMTFVIILDSGLGKHKHDISATMNQYQSLLMLTFQSRVLIYADSNII